MRFAVSEKKKKGISYMINSFIKVVFASDSVVA